MIDMVSVLGQYAFELTKANQTISQQQEVINQQAEQINIMEQEIQELRRPEEEPQNILTYVAPNSGCC
jgi:cell division protein FtsB